MSVAQQANDQKSSELDLLKSAKGLLSQQIWCWGRDILRPEGNWLLEIGFARTQPPPDQKNCSSVYTLSLEDDRNIVLRGFGIFYGDKQRGGVFLPRYESQPLFTACATLECPPWSNEDLPKMSRPTEQQRPACRSLTLDLIAWIHDYEVTIVERLGIEYRRSTLNKWDNGQRPFIPAEEVATAWRDLLLCASADFDTHSRIQP